MLPSNFELNARDADKLLDRNSRVSKKLAKGREPIDESSNFDSYSLRWLVIKCFLDPTDSPRPLNSRVISISLHSRATGVAYKMRPTRFARESLVVRRSAFCHRLLHLISRNKRKETPGEGGDNR